MVPDWVSVVAAPAVIAAVVSVAASGVAGIMRRRAEHRGWLRDVRHEKYAALIIAGRHLGAVMRFTGPYEEYPDELAEAYDQWFEAAVAAQLLASGPFRTRFRGLGSPRPAIRRSASRTPSFTLG